MPVIPCMKAALVKKDSCLVAQIVSFDTVGLHLEQYPSKDIALDLRHVILY